MAIAIVAIPSPDSYVWNISSEKIPHLTLMFLGDKLENLSRTEEFIAHAVDTSLKKFYLDVDRREILGDKSADVLLFGRYGIKCLENFRSYLLGDPNIAKAYSSTEQYDSWTPHLTLGYPDSPAKRDSREYPSVNTIMFDRIALWTGDYEGVEFPLKSVDNVLSMTAEAAGEAFIKHFGVKGMRWGVVRDKIRGNPAVKLASASEDHKKAQAVKTKAKLVGVQTLSNRDLQVVINRMNLEVNYKNLKAVEHDQSLLGKGKRWVADFVTDVAKDAAASWLKRPGSNFSGRTTARGRAWVGRQPVINGTVVPAAIGS